jgi:hypothetical protein
VRTFQKQYDYLTITLLSLSYNLQSNLRIYIVLTDDTSSVEDAHAISIIVNNLIGENIVSILPITSHDAYLIRNDNETDFGYGHTDAALNYLSKNGTTEQCHYFLITNGDNLYTKSFVDDYILKDMNEDYDIIGFDFISHYHLGTKRVDGYIHSDGSKVHLEAKFETFGIDLGAFIFKKDLLTQFDELRFVKQKQGKSDSRYQYADGYFVEYANSKTEKKIIHRQILFMHQ